MVIPARGGSKGIPRKNVRSLNGKPLIYYSIKNTLGLKYERVDCYVSSDDDEILLLAKKFGAKTLKRDSTKADDQTTLDPVVYDTYLRATKEEGVIYDLVVTLQPTSPLLSLRTLENAINHLEIRNLDTLIAGCLDTHLTWLKKDEKFFPNYEKRVNRQELPQIYKETGGFVITKSNFVTESSRFGKEISVFPLSKREAIDIDDFEDWSLCEYYLKQRRIVFVVSGNKRIGMGHVYNTLSVANEILSHSMCFVVDKDSQLAYDKISEFNYPVFIEQNQSLTGTIMAQKPDVVINDRLDTQETEIMEIKSKGVKVINFEDIGDGAAKSDLVVNAMYPEGKLILNHYFGSKYFILRDEFVFTPNIKINEMVGRVLLAFGGVDPNNFTERILDILWPMQEKLRFKIFVIAGLGYENYDKLRSKFPKIELRQNVKSISEEMFQSDLVFTSAGRTTFEVASMGVPAIVLCQNKRETTHFFASEKNGFYNLGLGELASDETIRNAFQTVLDYETRKEMHNRMVANDLKNGKKRVLNLINKVIEADNENN